MARPLQDALDGNIILIGMPGCGKSTVGVLLAKALGYDFIDTDVIIQLQEGEVLQELVACRGYLELRNIEQNVLLSLQITRTVLATGGSAVYAESAMDALANNGTVVYLAAPLETIGERIHNFGERGIACPADQGLAAVYNERVPLYEPYAELTVDASAPLEEVVSDLTTKLRQR